MRLMLLTYKPIGITLIYLILGLLWITTSDQITFLWFGANTMELTSAQIIKGIFFILITALILYFLVRRLYNRLNSYRKDLDSIFANPKLAYVKISSKGKVEDVSDSIISITGYESGELEDNYFFEMIPSKDLDIHKKLQNLMDSEENTISLETQIKAKDGHWTWVEINASITKNNIKHFLLSIHDISNLKKAEKLVSKELREKNALINNTEALIYSVDQDLCIVSFNSPFTEAFRKATNRQVKRGDSALLSEYSQEEQDKWESFYKRSLRGENFKTVEKIEVNNEILTFEVSFHSIYDNSEVVGVSIFAKNISKEIQTLEILKEREEYLQVITDHANEAIIACDMEGKLRFVNRTLKHWLNDEQPEEDLKKWGQKYHLYSRKDAHLLSPQQIPLLQILENRPLEDFEFEVKSPESSRIIKSSGSPLYDTNGQMIGAMSLWSDVTHLVEREVQISNITLEALETERSAIASELHDNLTQLLGIVSMNLKNLGLEEPKIKENKRYSTAKSLLEKSIEETRYVAYRITPKSISDFGLVVSIKELLEDYRSVNDLEINFNYNTEERMNDELELNLFRIIQEALNNVVRHAEADAVNIDLCVNNDKKLITANIEDDGKGFDPEKIENGLGLRTMKNRAHKLNGNFCINRKKNDGTALQVSIPLK